MVTAGALLFVLLASATAGCDLEGPIDLSWPVTQDSVNSTNAFCVEEHTGTHLDAPYYSNKDGWTVDEIPFHRLIANGVFLNVTDEVAGDVDFRLQTRHIDRWIKQNGPFPYNAMVLVSYGWTQLYGSSTYENTSDSFHLTFPGMSEDAARVLADMEEVVGVGVDTPSIDPPGSAAAQALLASRNIYTVELVKLSHPCLPARGFKVLSMPVKIVDGMGSPARVIAMPLCKVKHRSQPQIWDDITNRLENIHPKNWE